MRDSQAGGGAGGDGGHGGVLAGGQKYVWHTGGVHVVGGQGIRGIFF